MKKDGKKEIDEKKMERKDRTKIIKKDRGKNRKKKIEGKKIKGRR